MPFENEAFIDQLIYVQLDNRKQKLCSLKNYNFNLAQTVMNYAISLYSLSIGLFIHRNASDNS